jgi:hypothetical protein
VFWAQGRRVARSRYRRDRWAWRDSVVTGTALLVVGILVAVRIANAPALRYYPYAVLLPPFEPWLGVALFLLAVPALVGHSESSKSG